MEAEPGVLLHEVYITGLAGSSFRCSSVHRYLAGRNLWGKGKSSKGGQDFHGGFWAEDSHKLITERF